MRCSLSLREFCKATESGDAAGGWFSRVFSEVSGEPESDCAVGSTSGKRNRTGGKSLAGSGRWGPPGKGEPAAVDPEETGLLPANRRKFVVVCC